MNAHDKQAEAAHTDALESAHLWDVAIIGAGPAGATAAFHLAASGWEVLLLDKEAFPRDKVCGDGLIADSIQALKRLGLYEEVRRRGYKTHLGSVYSPSQIRFDVPGEFMTLKRVVLDELIVRQAVEQGARLCKRKVCRMGWQPDGAIRLHTEEGEQVQAKIGLLATGASMELASQLGLTRHAGPSAIALRCYVQSDYEISELLISYDRSITPGYGWIFPLGNGEYNVGCGVRYAANNPRPNLRAAFARFIKTFPLAAELFRQATSVTPLRGAMLRCGLTGAQVMADNLLLIGETIGATFPFTGEGIGKAMETGELAARLAHQALTTGDFRGLQAYPALLEAELKPKYLGYQIAENWLSNPWLNDLVARRIRKSRYLHQAIVGVINETVDPRQIFSLRGVVNSFFR